MRLPASTMTLSPIAQVEVQRLAAQALGHELQLHAFLRVEWKMFFSKNMSSISSLV